MSSRAGLSGVGGGWARIGVVDSLTSVTAGATVSTATTVSTGAAAVSPSLPNNAPTSLIAPITSRASTPSAPRRRTR